ncbi:MAG: class I SAM-dependent methyltransferase [Mesorhizobium sp.]|uniref:class I SAM-dependent methyltransferase n=1 Tax=Mesorhizobium sp. M7A.F.Ca.MR.176.00.0.0 TaxID=2496776 RepID=UPI000FD3056A|nr:class I SAM-dependent methyltransferase [Mesorhizobium sp. M7A.F.Ca.MR.176.00.0.0]RUU91868.1 class I SAM-dependent methyltransferase [Mesorhizobium sp. M7A.F.Ca.MR.176.00.0.0]TIN70546.1 MAG: class I SAM-dependent methyltransferase [Mesorhizobium sp.]TIU41518.1 MAG: class I SAM-dependent methyltransferase [Mesorhizobium sp.]
MTIAPQAAKVRPASTLGEMMDILDAYVATSPSAQNAVDIFKDEWSSKFPASAGATTTPGSAALFEDPRIDWLSKTIGGFGSKRILELGPLEAGHTYMMHEAGAESILAVEANSRSYLKCLCVKEIFDLSRARFLYGDAMKYLSETSERFDVCVASGILYHMTHPIEFLGNIARVSDTIFLWTHYYDDSLRTRKDLAKQFEKPYEIEVSGKAYTVSRRNYQEALKWAGFCGGGKPWAFWLTRDSLMRAIADFGFTVEAIEFDHPDHPNGPALALVARKA